MLMKWTALVITFRPSAGEEAETAKQKLEQKNALPLSCVGRSGGGNRTGPAFEAGLRECVRPHRFARSQPSAVATCWREVRGDGAQTATGSLVHGQRRKESLPAGFRGDALLRWLLKLAEARPFSLGVVVLPRGFDSRC